jgi:hypothetical protein
MRGFLAVARREIEEKRFVFLAAAVASLVPLAVPIVRGMRGANAAEVRDWCAVMGAATLGAALAIALGSTTIATDLAERRLGFYFSRPISGFGLWAGKLGAACLIALAAAAIVYAPTLAVNRGPVILIDLGRGSPLLFVPIVVATVVLLHAVNIAMRPRSPLLVLDVVALVVLFLAAVFLIQRFLMAFAVGALNNAFVVLIDAAVIGVLLAGLLAVTRGRSDSRAAHLALSATLWSILAAGVAVTAGYAAWVFSVAPKDLTVIDWVKPADKGSWIELHATARGWQPIFLFDTTTGRYRRAGASWIGPVLSHDGTRAAWFEASARGGPYDVVTWKLDDPGAKPVRTLSLPSIPYSTFLSDNGERLATIANGVLSVWDPAARASLGSARIAGEGSSLHGFFVDRNRIRVLRFKTRSNAQEENSLDILEFDLSTRTLAKVVTLDDAITCIADETGNRLLVLGKSRLSLRDGHTGTLIASLSERSPQRRAAGRFTSDGRIAVAVTEGPGASPVQERMRSVHVEVFTRDGRPERTLPIPGFQRLTFGGEVAPGQLVVAASRDSKGQQSQVVFIANLSTGEMRQVAEGLSPMRTLSETGSEATKLFFGSGHSLVHFDALTGERRVLLGREAIR